MSKFVCWAAGAALLSVGACATPAPKYAVVADPLGAGAATATAEAAPTGPEPIAEAAPAPVLAEVETPRAAPLGAVSSAPLPVLQGDPGGTAAPAPPASAQPAPVSTTAEVSALSHVVGVGDTFFAIGRRYGVGPLAVAQANGLTFGDTLRLGQRIQLPAGAVDRGPEAARPTGIRRADALTAPVAGSSGALLVSLNQDAGQTPVTPAPASPVAAPPITTSPAAPPVTTTPSTALPVQAPVQNTTPPALRPPAAIGTSPLATPSNVAPSVTAPPVVAPPQAQPQPATPIPATPSPFVTPAPTSPAISPGAAAAPAAVQFVWPLQGAILTRFGPTGVGQRSDGVNIATAEGTPVRASAAGTVVYAGDQVKGGFGKLVLVEHPGRWFTAYAHLSDIGVRMRDRVSQNQQLGLSGRTGNVLAPQLYFEVRHAPTPADRARPVDPLPLLPQ